MKKSTKLIIIILSAILATITVMALSWKEDPYITLDTKEKQFRKMILEDEELAAREKQINEERVKIKEKMDRIHTLETMIKNLNSPLNGEE